MMETAGKKFVWFKYYFLIILKFQVWNKMSQEAYAHKSFLLVKKSMLAACKHNSQHIYLSNSIKWKLYPLPVCSRIPPKPKNWCKFPNVSESLWPVAFFPWVRQRSKANSQFIASTVSHRDNSYSNLYPDWGSVETTAENSGKLHKAIAVYSPTIKKQTEAAWCRLSLHVTAYAS